MRAVVGASGRKGGGASRGARRLSLPVGRVALRSDEGCHACLPTGLAIADVPVVDISLASEVPDRRMLGPALDHRGLIPTRSQRDDDDDDDDDGDDDEVC